MTYFHHFFRTIPDVLDGVLRITFPNFSEDRGGGGAYEGLFIDNTIN